jgi:hypothetical protein
MAGQSRSVDDGGLYLHSLTAGLIEDLKVARMD